MNDSAYIILLYVFFKLRFTLCKAFSLDEAGITRKRNTK